MVTMEPGLTEDERPYIYNMKLRDVLTEIKRRLSAR